MSSIEIQKLELVEKKTADGRGRITLGPRFADATFKVIVDDVNGEIND